MFHRKRKRSSRLGRTIDVIDDVFDIAGFIISLPFRAIGKLFDF